MVTKTEVVMMGVQLAAGILANPANAAKVLIAADVQVVVRDSAQIVANILIENGIKIEGVTPVDQLK